MPRSAASAVALALGLAGCAPARTPVIELSAAPTATIGDDAAQARDAAARFLALEARGDGAADSLLASGADFVVTGVRVTVRPRLAGLNGTGDAVIEEGRTGVAGTVAWVVVSYRFAATAPALSERARATFILEKQRAGWRIRHVHSSMVERWDR